MRDWLGLVQSATGDKRSPAQTVSQFRLHRWPVGEPRLNAYGYVTNQASVSAWQAGEMPLVVGDRATTQELERMAAQMVGATTEVTKHLTTAIRSCARRPDAAAESLWRTLEAPFLATLREVPTALAGEDDDLTLGLRRAWATQMRHTALRLFSETCPIDRDPGKVVRAQHALRQGLYSQKLAETLALPMEGRNAKR